MRAKNHLLFLLFGTLFLLPSLFIAQEKDDPVFALDIRLKCGTKKVHDYVIYLGHKEKADDTVSIKKGKEVYVTLQRNEIYSVTFHKEGYLDKVLVINTELPEASRAEQIFTLSFEIEMIPEDPAAKKTTGILPSAYVKYDKKDDDFSLAENHHE